MLKTCTPVNTSWLVRSSGFMVVAWLLAASCTAPQNKQTKNDQVGRAASDSVAAAIRNGFSWAKAESTATVKPPVLVSHVFIPRFPTTKMFGVWALDLTAPHADFWLDAESFYLAEEEEEGNRPYVIEDDSIKIFYKSYTSKGRIVRATGDTLVLRLNGGEEMEYMRWRE